MRAQLRSPETLHISRQYDTEVLKGTINLLGPNYTERREPLWRPPTKILVSGLSKKISITVQTWNAFQKAFITAHGEMNFRFSSDEFRDE